MQVSTSGQFLSSLDLSFKKIFLFPFYLKAITLHMVPSVAVPDITFDQTGWDASWSYHL